MSKGKRSKIINNIAISFETNLGLLILKYPNKTTYE